MNILQTIIVAVFGVFAFSGFLFGVKNCVKKKNPYGLTKLYNLIGAFVWVDAVIFGLFWTIVCSTILFLSNWLLFLLFLSAFWLVRSIGETIYWIGEQFSSKDRNPPRTLWHSKIFPGDSSWVASQIFWQCISVVTAIISIYLVKILFF